MPCDARKMRIARIAVGATWAVVTIVAASCLAAGGVQSQNMSWVDCYFGGVSSIGSNGYTAAGVASRSCSYFSSYISCSDMMANVWANDSNANGAGDPSFSPQWRATDSLRTYAMDQCKGRKAALFWEVGWPTAFLLLLSLLAPVLAFKWRNDAALVLLPLCLVTLTLLLKVSGAGTVSTLEGVMYWCEGLSDSDYGGCNLDVETMQPVPTTPTPLGFGGVENFGATLPSCYSPPAGATAWDEERFLYQAPGGKCACDQDGNNEDVFFQSLKHNAMLADAGRWMGIMSQIALMVWCIYRQCIRSVQGSPAWSPSLLGDDVDGTAPTPSSYADVRNGDAGDGAGTAPKTSYGSNLA